MEIKNKDFYVFAEQRDGIIQNVVFELLGKARELANEVNGNVYAILAGYNIKEKAKELIYFGADTVLLIDDTELKDYLTESYSQAIVKALEGKNPSIVLIGATTIGRDLGPRLSARLATGLTADCTKLDLSEDGEFQMTRPAFGGNLMATIICPNHRPQMSTVRPGVMKIGHKDTTRKGNIEEIKVNFDKSKFKIKILETVKENKNLIDITEAKILISGGRGVGTTEGFDMLKKLAKTINDKTEISSSRAMVDAGVMPQNRQVGQTGKTVRPELYFALGISGAIQHLAGMEESEYIIAINKDKHAPIFQTASLGIVGDVHKIIPLLTDRLSKEKKIGR